MPNDNPQQGGIRNDGSMGAEAADHANNHNHHSKRNHHYDAPPRGSKIPPTQKDARKLFVGGLPANVTEGEFRAFFEGFGVVMDSIVMIDRDTRRSRGFGFVTFADPVCVCLDECKMCVCGWFERLKMNCRGGSHQHCTTNLDQPLFVVVSIDYTTECGSSVTRGACPRYGSCRRRWTNLYEIQIVRDQGSRTSRSWIRARWSQESTPRRDDAAITAAAPSPLPTTSTTTSQGVGVVSRRDQSWDSQLTASLRDAHDVSSRQHVLSRAPSTCCPVRRTKWVCGAVCSRVLRHGGGNKHLWGTHDGGICHGSTSCGHHHADDATITRRHYDDWRCCVAAAATTCWLGWHKYGYNDQCVVVGIVDAECSNCHNWTETRRIWRCYGGACTLRMAFSMIDFCEFGLPTNMTGSITARSTRPSDVVNWIPRVRFLTTYRV